MAQNVPAMPTNRPLVLIVRDGWGQNPRPEHDPFNAIKLAKTPVAAKLMREYPTTLIKTSGEDVGLPEGQMGNSEVGHQNIGAGRIVDQEMLTINKGCRAGLDKNKVFTNAVATAKSRQATLHLMGIGSDAGVHGLLEHLYACLRGCKSLGQTKVCVHLFTDGRDSGPFEGKRYAEEVESKCREIGVGVVATVIGRYYAMDRDNRWERVESAYRALTGYRVGAETFPVFPAAGVAIQSYYDHPSTPSQNGDEFIKPMLIGKDFTEALSRRIRDNDVVLFYNYRGDRPREIIRAFVLDPFEGAVAASPDNGRKGFDRGPKLNVHMVTMTAYEEALNPYVHVMFPKPPRMVNIAGEFISNLGLTQFRCAETEKYPHVTFFFNDYRDEPFPGEKREIIQSPKVATYDLQPDMSAPGVCEAVLRRLMSGDCEDVIVVNFANADMVGHTGSLPAAIKACETVDQCVGAIVDATLKRSGCLIVTADHGNSEQMWDPETNSPHTRHTTYEVPLIVVGAPFKGRKLREGGRLADILPTGLDMLGVKQPAEMTGRSLLA